MSDFGGAAVGILDEPIGVKRRRHLKHPWIWLAGIVAAFVCLLLLRVALIRFPAFSEKAVPVGDGLRVLRGAFDLLLTGRAEPGRNTAAVQAAFASGMSFVVAVDRDVRRVVEVASRAPLSVVAAQQIDTSWGRLAAIGPAAGIEIKGRPAGLEDLLARIHQAGAWSVIENPAGGDGAWTNWDALGYRAIEFLDMEDGRANMDFWDLLGYWAGKLLGTPYAWSYLGLRPSVGLARWDDAGRRARVVGLCGYGAAVSARKQFDAMATYLFVADGLGPYEPSEIDRALKAGHHFCALPAFGDFSGFRFLARTADSQTKAIMGDSLRFKPGLRLEFDLHLPRDPGNLTFYLYQDGRLVSSGRGPSGSHEVKSPGAYRVELGVRFADLPWGESERRVLYSNPIFVVEKQP